MTIIKRLKKLLASLVQLAVSSSNVLVSRFFLLRLLRWL